MTTTTSHLRARSGCALLLSLCAASAASGQASIIELPSLTGSGWNEPTGISSDGLVVIGRNGGRAFRWSQAHGMQDWGALPNLSTLYWPLAVSDDGAVAAGEWQTLSPSGKAIRWTRHGGAQDLGFIDESGQDPNARARDLTGDGQLVVGYTTDGGFAWDPVRGMRIIPGFSPRFINRPGTMMVGPGAGVTVARWSEGAGVEPVGGAASYSAAGISDDGTVIIANAIDGSGAARWTQETGFVPIPPPEGRFGVTAGAVSPDATVVVGTVNDSRPWIWHDGLLNADLKFLLLELGVDISAWASFGGATGVSADGAVIVGSGSKVGSEFDRTGWLVRLRPTCGSADFDHDGDVGTDLDIERFFACLAGNCCDTCYTCDFNGDGQSAQDTDIEAFFRVLAGLPC